MKTRENVLTLYPFLGYWLMMFIPLVLAGFYFTYFTRLNLPQPSIIHFHFTMMALWLGLVITQPLLIRFKKIKLHRTLGKASYFLIPFLILSSWLMMRYSFDLQTTNLEAQLSAGTLEGSVEEAKMQIANFLAVAFSYLFWLGFFYILAIAYRKTPSLHARYMVAASLTFMGPTVDRILIFWFEFYGFGPGWPVETIGFLIIDILILSLLIRDLLAKKSPVPYLICLATFLFIQLLDMRFSFHPIWEKIVSFLLQ